jgi:sugar O-acyltransferase (sialic acid O-acetyltransferase NeuD family)
MSKVIIFGVQDFAQLADYYLRNDSEHEVVAFSVNEEYLPEGGEFLGKPVIAFEEIENTMSPDDFVFFAPLSPKGMNTLRQKVYLDIKDKGYKFINYISSKATILNDYQIGENCFILENNTIQPFTKIGNNVVLWSGNHIGHHGEIKDHVSFTSHVVMSGHCLIEENSFFGVNSTLRDGLRIAKGSLIAMGATVNKNTEEWSVYIGSPAKKLEGKNSIQLL